VSPDEWTEPSSVDSSEPSRGAQPQARGAGSGPEPVVQIRSLVKSYGSIQALRGIDLGIQRGEVFGYLGPNGAGKTTTLRILLGLLRPTSGSAHAFGLDCWHDRVAIKRRLGYLAGDIRLYGSITGRQLLDLLDRLRGGGAHYHELAERLRLDLGLRVKSYSKGNKQKLGIVQALMHRPELLILDEPTTALDPLVQHEVYAILEDERRRGTTVVLSSHVLSEVQRVCERVAIVREGQILQVATVDRLRRLDRRRVEAFFTDPEAGERALRDAGFEPTREGGAVVLRVTGFDALIAVLAGQSVRSLVVEPLSLEEIFFEVYRGGDAVPEEDVWREETGP
jgi:ABC-2 type transport system ATP-binding protein